MNNPKDLPKWLWLWLPIILLLLPFVARIITPSANDFMYGELGIIENITVIILLLAIVTSVKTFIKLRNFQFPIFKAWIALLFLGCVYYAGEELSWGQHWLGWDTPESWQGVNDQNETNLHNTNAFLDQVPRTILTLAAIVGGIIIPLIFIKRGSKLSTSDFGYWLWPTFVNIPTCIATVAISLPKKICKLFGSEVPDILNIRAGESKEAILAMFLFIYVASFYTRLAKYKASQ